MSVARDRTVAALLELLKLALIGLTVKVAAGGPASAAPAPVDLTPLRAEIREQFSEVRAEVRDMDRRLVAIERR